MNSLIDRWNALSDRQRDAVVWKGIFGIKCPSASCLAMDECSCLIIPAYTTSLDAAADVSANLPEFDMEIFDPAGSSGVDCRFTGQGNKFGNATKWVTQPTMPCAICLAALLTSPADFARALDEVEQVNK